MLQTGFMSEAVQKRRANVMRLRGLGLTTAEIAAEEVRQGHFDQARPVSAVALDVREALKKLGDEAPEDTNELRVTLESERLDRMQRSMETVLAGAQNTNRCPNCQRAGDPALVLKANADILRLMERRAALLDLDLRGKGGLRQRESGKLDELKKRRDRKLGSG